MLMPSDLILKSSVEQLQALAGREDMPEDAAVELGMLAMVLQPPANFRSGQYATLHAHVAALAEILRSLQSSVRDQPDGDHVASCLTPVIAHAEQSTDTPETADAFEDRLQTLLEAFESALSQAEDAAPATIRNLMASEGRALLDWEQRLHELVNAPPPPSADSPEAPRLDPITTDSLQACLDRRYPQSRHRVTHLRHLPGGYGKQTILVDIEGDQLSGSYVIRRDTPVALLENDCHYVSRELPLLRAAHEQGIPAPYPYWLEQQSEALWGGDFILMDRMPGSTPGDVFASDAELTEAQLDELARVLAAIHAMAPSEELGAEIEALHPALWQKSCTERAREYIGEWKHMYRQSPHIEFMAIHTLLDWALTHIPDAPERTALVHGDYGFHNLMMDDDRISGVLDWEFAHVGDPAEDLGNLRNSLEPSADWARFMERYTRHGGADIPGERVRFFQVWAHLRNACAGSMAAALFRTGQVPEIKLASLPYAHIPKFVNAARALMEQQEESNR